MAEKCEQCRNLGEVDGCERCGRVCAQPAPGGHALKRLPPIVCKCGIARDDCDYHRPAPAAYPWGFYG